MNKPCDSLPSLSRKLSIEPLWRALLFSLLAFLLSLSLISCSSESSSQDKSKEEDRVAEATSEDDEVNKDEKKVDSDKKASDKEAEKNKKKTKKRRERITSVQGAHAARADLVIPIIAEGTIRARHSAEILTEIEGRLIRIYADEGQQARKGQLIAKIDGREFEVAIEEARANYLEALSRLAVEEESLQAIEIPSYLQDKIKELDKLERAGKISREERISREIAMDVEALREGIYRIDIVAARSGVSAARAALERARLNLERSEIRAPFAGAVTGLTLSMGEQVTKGQLICTLVNNIDIEAEVGVLEADLGSLATGRPALLVFPSLGDTLRVKVDVISPQFNRDTRTCQVLMRFRSEGNRIMPGMFVRAIIAGETFTDRLLVPKEAILTRDGRPLLFKVENGQAKWLYLRLGNRNDSFVEVERVLQGGTLSAGDVVVVSNHLTLAHDAKIKVKKIAPTNDPWNSHLEDN